MTYSTIDGEKTRFTCLACGAETEFQSCPTCFSGILKRTLETYESIGVETPNRLSNDDIPADLVILAAFCSIKLAAPQPDIPCTKLPVDSARTLFRSLLLLERQLAFSPKNSQLLLLLLQLHLLVGSGPRARQIFEELTIKRTVMDSLGPLFYDRLSIVAPALLSPSDDYGWQLMDMLSGHYSVSLKLRMPRRLFEAFESESYSSILTIPKYITDLRISCTRAMSLVEEARSERMLGNPTWELLSEKRFSKLASLTYMFTPAN